MVKKVVRFCTACGNPMVQMASIIENEAQNKVCPNCSTKVETDATFCTECGTKL